MADRGMDTGNAIGKQLGIQLPSPEQQIEPPWRHAESLSLWVKRDDLIHPVISGNKWRKLSGTLQQAVQTNVTHMLSFGGGFSNHLHALGYACKQLNIRFTALVRGDYRDNMTPMLDDLSNWGTELVFVDRLTYQKRQDPDYLRQLQQRFAAPLIVPEGGSSRDALAGMDELVSELHNPYDVILAPVASGGTLAGLIASRHQKARILGIAMLKGRDYLESLVGALVPEVANRPWHIEHGFHHGGYAKTSPELLAFCADFSAHSKIAVEPVYSGKLFYAAQQLVEQQAFAPGSKILLLHTGGLQGAR